MSKEALRAQQELMQLTSDFAASMADFARQPSLQQMDRLGAVLEGLERPMRKIDLADDDDRAMELLRALEMHGDGLLAYQSKGFKFIAGDVLITAARELAVVTAVNQKGEIKEVAGAGTSKGVTGGKFVLTWRPVTQARRWLGKNEQGAGDYADLDAALVYVVRQWNNKQSDEGRDVSTGPGFFLDAAKAPGLKLKTGDLSGYVEHADIVAFCGSGLVPFAGATPVAGDFILMRKNKAWGVVTRRQGAAIDAVVGGLAGKGPLGEPVGAVRIMRGIAAADIDKLWRPAAPKTKTKKT